MSVKLLNEQHLEFLNLKGGCTGSSESPLVKMPHCWKSSVMARLTLSVIAVIGNFRCNLHTVGNHCGLYKHHL